MALGDGIRRNITSVSEEERNLFVAAIRQLDSGSMVYPNNLGHEGADGAGNITYWDMMEQIHKDGHAHGTDVHVGPAFIPWHRAIVNHFEELLRQVDPRLSLHYWDWTTDPRAGAVPILGPSGFMGSASGDAGVPFQDFESTEGGGHNFIWRDVAGSDAKPDGRPDITSDADILAATNYTDFHNLAKNAHDVTAHSYIGGTITQPHYSFHDPMVFLLHSNLDRLWATWQRAPGHPERLDTSVDPSTGTARAYGNILADSGLPASYYDELVQPWGGGAGNTDLEPWRSDVSQQIHVAYKDPQIILPASFDTAVHSGYVVTDRDTFSSVELESTHSYPQAFYVIYDGFTPNELGGAIPTISFHDGSIGGANISSISALNSSATFENAAAVDMPQRISFTFEINFADNSAFTFAGEMRNLVLKAELGSQICAAAIHLINQPNPYMIDVQPGGSNPGWLSTDVRVFQLRPGAHLPGSNTALSATAGRAEAYQYIQNLLGELRGLGNGPSPFDFISQDEQASQLELSRTVGGVRVFNFAVAKVRYRANTTDAADVRVFFRGFNMMVSALDYTNPAAADGNYRRSASGNIPLLGKIGSDIASIPYFAQERVNSASDDMNNQLDNTNKFTINHIANQEAVGYFGCWLDFNQTEDQFPLHPAGDGHFSGRQPILQLIRGIHQCLVAEVRFQPGMSDPIPLGATPGSSDRLAQRNLAIVESDNPGTADAHTVQHTLTVKPSAGVGKIFLAATRVPHAYDELVIRWNNLPRNAKATLYFPEWNADDILSLTTELRQHPELLKKVDAHTLECAITDISYIPVPANNTKPYAGLITLVLPQTVKDGQLFHVDVQQHSGVVREAATEQVAGKNKRKTLHYFASNRKVLGAFRMTVAVKLGDGLLRKAVRNLAVLRYIALAIPSCDRWYPIFSRYIKQLAGQVDALGYDSNLVTASADDPGMPDETDHQKEHDYTGKVHRIYYNCFGNFTGFVLVSCKGDVYFETCERGIERILLDACKNNSTLKVTIDNKRIQQLAIVCC
ncbi:MAG: tyrosinase family protein [Betaproteobacteria bacterium]|nr:tyrosinase family protein [Betaproteobacteria bacterium]